MRVLVFHTAEESTAGCWVRLARERLRPIAREAAFAGGTNACFCELNRTRPEVAAMDAVAFSVNPQVHAFDELSLVETLATQGEVVRSARAFCGDRPLVVSPVTLKPRFNPVATGPDAAPTADELPPQVDPRQMSLFAAGWTVGSLKHLAEGGAASLTYYETTGWRGVLEAETGPARPARFPSAAGAVFPAYHMFADVADWKTGEVIACDSTDPLAVVALAVRATGSIRVLASNLTARERRVTLGGLGAARAAVRLLDAESAPAAMTDPSHFRAAALGERTADRDWTIALPSYATARIDALPPSPKP